MHDELKRRTGQMLAQGARQATSLGVIPSAEQPSPLGDWRAEVGRASDYLTVFDLDLCITYVNRAQPGARDVLGSQVTNWIAPAQRETFLNAIALAYVSGLPNYYDTWGIGPDGATVGYRSWVVPLPGESGVGQFAAISVDLSHVERVERELAEQTSVLTSIARDAPDHIMIIDREHRIQFVNHLIDEFRAADILQSTTESFLPESERARVFATLESVFTTGESISYEVPLDLASGRRWYMTRAGPIVSGGKVLRALLITSDVTEQHVRELLAAREKYVLDALERVNRRIVSESDLDRMIQAVLEELLHIFGATRICLCEPRPADASGFLVSHEQKRDDAAAWLGLRLAEGSAYHAHLTETLAADGARSFSAEAPAQTQGAEPPGVGSALSVALFPRPEGAWLLSVHHDRPGRDHEAERVLLETLAVRIAEGLNSLLAQRALRQSEERFRTLVEHAPEAIIILDVDTGCFVEANANAEQLFGMSREVLLRSGFVDLCPERQPDGRLSAPLINAALDASLAGKTPTFELQQHDSAGRLLFSELRLVRLPHAERRLVRGSISDISARKRAEEDNRALAAQLAQAHKMQAIGQLTGGIAHDFNNLLTVILGSLALMELPGTDASAVREFARQADAAAQRAASLTQRLLAFSRRQPLRPQSVDLRALLAGMEQLLRRTLHESIALEVHVVNETWSCEADPVQLESAILNLAINARDAMPAGGLLKISAENAPRPANGELDQAGLVSGDYVRILVCDTGSGMAPEVLAQAFEPFFTTKDIGEGSGLGLSMVYGFIKQSGGHVQIHSEVGKGTEIALHLPRAKRAASSPSLPAQCVQPDGEGQLILVVEDDAGVRQLVCEMLSRLGYRTLAAEDARQALRLLPERHDIAMMLTDMALPGGMSGADLVARVRRERPSLPMLFMTGYSNDAITNDQQRTHGVRLLSKPFSRASLASAVLDTLNERQE